jgi:hypothetical protein
MTLELLVVVQSRIHVYFLYMDWIIISFFIYLEAFIVEQLEKSTCTVILVASPSLEN